MCGHGRHIARLHDASRQWLVADGGDGERVRGRGQLLDLGSGQAPDGTLFAGLGAGAFPCSSRRGRGPPSLLLRGCLSIGMRREGLGRRLGSRVGRIGISLGYGAGHQAVGQVEAHSPDACVYEAEAPIRMFLSIRRGRRGSRGSRAGRGRRRERRRQMRRGRGLGLSLIRDRRRSRLPIVDWTTLWRDRVLVTGSDFRHRYPAILSFVRSRDVDLVVFGGYGRGRDVLRLLLDEADVDCH